MATPVYNPKNVTINLFGYALEGLAPDTFIEFALNSDTTDEEVGGDGSVSISMSPDETGTCTISLQQSSPSNILLSGILALQAEQGTIVSGAFTVKDPSGTVIAKMTGAHIKTAPSVAIGSTATGSNRDWVIFIQKLQFLPVPEGFSDSAGTLADVSASIENAKQFLL